MEELDTVGRNEDFLQRLLWKDGDLEPAEELEEKQGSEKEQKMEPKS